MMRSVGFCLRALKPGASWPLEETKQPEIPTREKKCKELLYRKTGIEVNQPSFDDLLAMSKGNLHFKSGMMRLPESRKIPLSGQQ